MEERGIAVRRVLDRGSYGHGVSQAKQHRSITASSLASQRRFIGGSPAYHLTRATRIQRRAPECPVARAVGTPGSIYDVGVRVSTTEGQLKPHAALWAARVSRRSKYGSRTCAKASATEGAIEVLPPTTAELEAAAEFEKSCQGGQARQAALDALSRAAADKSVKPRLLTGALAFLEAHQQTPTGGSIHDTVRGSWQLFFSSASSIPAFQYLPVNEDMAVLPGASPEQFPGWCDVAPSGSPRGTITLQTLLGPCVVTIPGRFEWVSETDMRFQFLGAKITLYGREVWRKQAEFPAKIYRYFLADPTTGLAACRSSGGGLVLLKRRA